MNRKELAKSNFMLITHGTFMEHLENILKSGYLKPLAGEYLDDLIKNKENFTKKLDADKLSDSRPFDQYTGVYTALHSIDSIDFFMEYRKHTPSLFSEHIEFIFPITLLQRRGWHLNTTDNYGAFRDNTYTYKSIHTLPKLQLYEELVFHYPIDINLAGYLLVSPHNFDTVNKMLKKYNSPIQCVIKTNFVPAVYDKPVPVPFQIPNFVYDNFGNYVNKDIILYEGEIKAILDCARLPVEYFDINNPNYAIMKIRQVWMDIVLGVESLREPMWYPPFPKTGKRYITADDNLLHPM